MGRTEVVARVRPSTRLEQLGDVVPGPYGDTMTLRSIEYGASHPVCSQTVTIRITLMPYLTVATITIHPSRRKAPFMDLCAYLVSTRDGAFRGLQYGNTRLTVSAPFLEAESVVGYYARPSSAGPN